MDGFHTHRLLGQKATGNFYVVFGAVRAKADLYCRDSGGTLVLSQGAVLTSASFASGATEILPSGSSDAAADYR